MFQVRSKTRLILADDTTQVIELHPFEVHLLHKLRNDFKFGDVLIKMRDGLPMCIERAVERIDLTKLDTSI